MEVENEENLSYHFDQVYEFLTEEGRVIFETKDLRVSECKLREQLKVFDNSAVEYFSACNLLYLKYKYAEAQSSIMLDVSRIKTRSL